MNSDTRLNQLLDSVEMPPASADIRKRISEETRPARKPLFPALGGWLAAPAIAAAAAVLLVLAVMFEPAPETEPAITEAEEQETLFWLLDDEWDKAIMPEIELDEATAYSYLYGVDE